MDWRAAKECSAMTIGYAESMTIARPWQIKSLRIFVLSASSFGTLLLTFINILFRIRSGSVFSSQLPQSLRPQQRRTAMLVLNAAFHLCPTLSFSPYFFVFCLFFLLACDLIKDTAIICNFYKTFIYIIYPSSLHHHHHHHNHYRTAWISCTYAFP